MDVLSLREVLSLSDFNGRQVQKSRNSTADISSSTRVLPQDIDLDASSTDIPLSDFSVRQVQKSGKSIKVI